jgi:hypothetical protein
LVPAPPRGAALLHPLRALENALAVFLRVLAPRGYNQAWRTPCSFPPAAPFRFTADVCMVVRAVTVKMTTPAKEWEVDMFSMWCV